MKRSLMTAAALCIYGAILLYTGCAKSERVLIECELPPVYHKQGFMLRNCAEVDRSICCAYVKPDNKIAACVPLLCADDCGEWKAGWSMQCTPELIEEYLK